MPNPLFSIITVTFNPGEGLARTVDSLSAQRCRDFEQIIKDAGSTDGSVQQLARQAKDYTPIVICQPDNGIFDAMNQALDHASGKYVLFLNAGDLLFDGGVLEQVAKVVTQEVDLGLVYGDYFSGPLQLVVKSPKRLSGFFLYRTTLCHQSCFAAREQIEKLGRFDTTYPVVADYDLLLRMVLGASVPYQYLPKTLCWYLGGGSSTQPVNAWRGGREAQTFRRRYFRPMERLLYGCLRAASLPYLRIELMRSRRLATLQKMYTRAVNLWNS